MLVCTSQHVSLTTDKFSSPGCRFTKHLSILWISLYFSSKLIPCSHATPIEKNWRFQSWKWNAFSLISPYISRFFSALKVKCFQPDFIIFFTHFFSPTVKTLNILSALKFTGSHLAFYDWKVNFSLISPIIFSLGTT